MSHIDRALRTREQALGSRASNLDTIGGPRGRLDQYAAEGAPHDRTTPTAAVVAPPASAAAAATTRRHEGAGPTTSTAPSATPLSPAAALTRRRMLLQDEDLQARLVTGAPGTTSLEQYRRLAAALHEEQMHGQLKTVMVTSALPGEGKTLTVVNLALTLSESYGRRVLVVDADLRWPSLHTVLTIPNDRGLCEALATEGDDLPIVDVTAHLSVLTAGTPGHSPLAALSSPRMKQVVDACAQRFDWVLVDTSPVGVLPDAQVLVRVLGAVVLVVGAGSTPAAAVERTIAELGGPDAIVGVVLNRIEERRVPESSYYQQYEHRYEH